MQRRVALFVGHLGVDIGLPLHPSGNAGEHREAARRALLLIPSDSLSAASATTDDALICPHGFTARIGFPYTFAPSISLEIAQAARCCEN
jgi:hypothetical protein